ncbi:MAG: ribosomal protein S18-alanine N-acetyltransferase [Shewanella sp.]|nr:ribosomal protein S18-alanine N-acetyltransferase [Shewanella sp.]MCF1429832.1 ribosomal protein S18-alanine N-acetyltransferase [Shewanella sp.]MCF1458206.1 ribosomal protein S18-alanine N-acetyltransferase [Shewanella sp.]
MSVDIRKLNVVQAPLMAQIATMAHSHPMSLNTIESCFGNFYQSFGVFEQSTLAGFVILHQLFEVSTVIDICLEPGYQGRRLGKALMLKGIDWLNTTEAELLLLEVRAGNVSAIALYRKLGFEVTGERKGYYRSEESTEDAVLMSLSLKAGKLPA